PRAITSTTRAAPRPRASSSLGTFFRDEVATPLGLDFWIGLPAEEEPRVAPSIPAGLPGPGETISIFLLRRLRRIRRSGGTHVVRLCDEQDGTGHRDQFPRPEPRRRGVRIARLRLQCLRKLDSRPSIGSGARRQFPLRQRAPGGPLEHLHGARA